VRLGGVRSGDFEGRDHAFRRALESEALNAEVAGIEPNENAGVVQRATEAGRRLLLTGNAERGNGPVVGANKCALDVRLRRDEVARNIAPPIHAGGPGAFIRARARSRNIEADEHPIRGAQEAMRIAVDNIVADNRAGDVQGSRLRAVRTRVVKRRESTALAAQESVIVIAGVEHVPDNLSLLVNV